MNTSQIGSHKSTSQGLRMRRIQKEKTSRSGSHRHTPTRGGRGASMASTASTSSNYTNHESTTEQQRSLSERSIEPMNILPEDDRVFAELPYSGTVKGVVEYLGTRQGTAEFSNPAYLDPTDPNVVVVRASSRIEGDLASLTGFRHEEGAFFETDSALSSWVSIELPIPLKISHYTLGYYIKGEEHVPRNWVSCGKTHMLLVLNPVFRRLLKPSPYRRSSQARIMPNGRACSCTKTINPWTYLRTFTRGKLW